MEEIFYEFLRKNEAYEKYIKAFEKEYWYETLKTWLATTRKEDWINSAFQWGNDYEYWSELNNKWIKITENIDKLLSE